LLTFDFLYFNLIVTTVALCIHALKEKEDPVAEDVPSKTPLRDRHVIAMDVEVVKITNENLATSEGQDAAETIAIATPDDIEQEKRAEV
jgi:hypothetical protein